MKIDRFWLILLLGIFVSVLVAALFVLALLLKTDFERPTDKLLLDAYMNKVWVLERDSILGEGLRGTVDKAYFNLQVLHEGEYYFSPYRLTLSSVKEEGPELTKESTVRYRIVDVYQIHRLDSSTLIGLCIFCNVEGMEDIVFEKVLPSKHLLETLMERRHLKLSTVHEMSASYTCSWTQERYEKVINSPRCKLRKEIIKHIAPGDRTKKVSGWWWNF